MSLDRFNAGALSEADLRKLVRGQESPLIERWEEKNLYAARYDVRMAPDGCRTPEGRFIPFDSNDPNEQLIGSLVIHPGESAWISTYERFSVPANLTGTVTLKSHMANRGLLLLCGNVIDPRYGLEKNTGSDRRLRFFLANLGSNPIVITPEETRVASVQFWTVRGDAEAADEVPVAPPYTKEGLGFFDRLGQLQKDYEELGKEVHRSRDLLHNLIVLGYFVLGTAIISAGLASLLAIGANKSLDSDIARAVPDTLAGKGLAAASILSVAWIIYSIAMVFGPSRTLEPAADVAHIDRRDLAVMTLRRRARIHTALFLCAVPFPICLVVWAATRSGAFSWSFWPLWVLVASLLVAGLFFGLARLSRPLEGRTIRAEMDRLAVEEASTS
jgi:deoxycytidine triphosphate deaminase